MAGRARAAAARNNGQLDDRSWMIWKQCGYCAASICVNNYDDRKSRTRMFLGLVICLRCDPREYSVENGQQWRKEPVGPRPIIKDRTLYRTIMSTWLARVMATGQRDPEWVQRQALKLWDEEGNPRE